MARLSLQTKMVWCVCDRAVCMYVFHESALISTWQICAEIDNLKEKLQEEEEKTRTAAERVEILEKKVAEMEEQLGAARKEAEVNASVSQALVSPRSSDIEALRKRFKEAHLAMREKDEEIDELHKLLFELRPQLEREVEGQVRGIMQQAERDAGRIRQGECLLLLFDVDTFAVHM
jgi:hypothetical protein